MFWGLFGYFTISDYSIFREAVLSAVISKYSSAVRQCRSFHTLSLAVGQNVTLLPWSVISKSATANLAVSQSAIV
jgi:hypothetical protein